MLGCSNACMWLTFNNSFKMSCGFEGGSQEWESSRVCVWFRPLDCGTGIGVLDLCVLDLCVLDLLIGEQELEC